MEEFERLYSKYKDECDTLTKTIQENKRDFTNISLRFDRIKVENEELREKAGRLETLRSAESIKYIEKVN